MGIKNIKKHLTNKKMKTVAVFLIAIVCVFAAEDPLATLKEDDFGSTLAETIEI